METSGQSAVWSFLRRLGRWVRNYFVFVGVITSLLLFLAYRVANQYSGVNRQAQLAPGEAALLHLKLSGEIAESSPEGHVFAAAIRQFMGAPSAPYIPDLKARLEKAAADERVRGLFVEFADLGGSMAGFSELREILAAFREKGKPLYAWFATVDHKVFYLASVADEIYMAPAGDMMLSGPTFQLVYFGEALKKLGVEIDVVRAGKYKAAFEPFILNQPSPETLEMYNALEASLSEHMTRAIAASRQLPDTTIVHDWFVRTLFTPALARERGLVHDLAYADEVKTRLAEATKARVFDFDKYEGADDPLSKLRTGLQPQEAGIALIEAVGEIHMSQRGTDQVIDPTSLGKELNWARESDNVKAVVLRISSPGGSAVASDLIWDAVRRVAEKKPLVVSMGGYAASGGYYMAAPATKIFALPTTITGSIGVIGMVPKFRAFEEKYGVSFHIVTQSARRGLLNPGARSSSEDREIFKHSIDSTYQTFLKRVSHGRSMALADVDRMAQGRVWTGAQAKELGLVDELGSLSDAFAEAKRLAQIDSETKVPVLRWQPDVRSFSDCLANMRECLPSARAIVKAWRDDELSLSQLPTPLKALGRLQSWTAYVDDEPLQAMWEGHFAEALAR